MAEGNNNQTSIEEDRREQLKREIEEIRNELTTDLTEIRTRLGRKYVMEKAVIYMAGRTGEAVGTSIGLFRRFKKRTAA